MPKIPVKVMKIVKADTPLSYGAPGQLRGTDEVEVHSRVSGSIVEKYFKGGDAVRAGAPLYRIDSRQYETAVLQARANLHKAESDLRNAQEDLARNEMLFKDKAVSEQTVTNKRADVAAHLATVEAQQAALKKAQESLDDTIVYAPMSGRVSVDDVAVGAYATAGTTRLVTIGSIDPVYVQFGISETEYLNILAEDIESGAEIDENKYQLPKIKVMLTNGREYPYEGQIVMVDRALSDNSGSITLKALLPNPQGILLPGMFTQVRIVGVVEKDALLVPTRAVQQLLDENFVLVVGEDGKSTSKKIKLGERVGSYYIVTSGLTESDSVIVEGLTNLRGGAELDIITVTPEEMGFSINETSEIVDKS
ncbi:MAG: efflux RND transporter periplasmic adaptor subunit [Selenomonadaceae bacterium]|nr:efflux RND transporter periplasmic adaptor subunit [Selenomonadaceae bacterium]